MNDQTAQPWPHDPADELQHVFGMFETIWEIMCDAVPGRRERTAGVVAEIRNRLKPGRPARQRPQPKLKLIQGGKSCTA